jgi:hypothetical protein
MKEKHMEVEGLVLVDEIVAMNEGMYMFLTHLGA